MVFCSELLTKSVLPSNDAFFNKEYVDVFAKHSILMFFFFTEPSAAPMFLAGSFRINEQKNGKRKVIIFFGVCFFYCRSHTAWF